MDRPARCPVCGADVDSAKSEALRAMQAEGQKLADILKEYQAGFRPGFTRRVDAALAE